VDGMNEAVNYQEQQWQQPQTLPLSVVIHCPSENFPQGQTICVGTALLSMSNADTHKDLIKNNF